MVFHVQISNTKTKLSKEFFVTVGGIQGLDTVEIIRKYLALRPQYTNHWRFFVGYRKGFCTIQPVGSNTVCQKTWLHFWVDQILKRTLGIASDALPLPDLLTINCHGGWKSNTVAGGYTDTSKENIKKLFLYLFVINLNKMFHLYIYKFILEDQNELCNVITPLVK